MKQRQDEAKALPLGTVRDWKRGQVIKTARGWEPVTDVPASVASSVGGSVPAPSTSIPASVSITADDLPKSRKAATFSPQQMATALAAFHSDPLNPDAQLQIRAGLRRLCADYGMLDRDENSPEEGRFAYLEGEKTATALGVHTWEGGILVRADQVKYAWKESQRLAGDPTREKKDKYALGFHVLTHEAVHGHSPIDKKNFKGRFRLLEEATTEMASRKINSEISGIPMAQFAKIGAYGEFCSALYQGTKAALARFGIDAVPPETWYDILGEASIEMRRRPPLFDKSKEQYTRRFAESLPLPAAKIGDKAPQIVEEVAKAIWVALAPAKEKEKLYRLLGKQKQVKDPDQLSLLANEIAAQQKVYEAAQQAWQTYTSGKGAATENRRDRMVRLLREAVGTDEDTEMLPRNNLAEAILYARVLSDQDELTEDAIRDLAMLQDDVAAGHAALSAAIIRYDLNVVDPMPVAADTLVF